MSNRRSRRPSGRVAPKFNLERLEPRVLLTTLVGGGMNPLTGTAAPGDIFEFTDASGNNVRISVGGNIEADFIGGIVDDQNHLLLTDLPGTYFGSDVGRTGTDYLGGVSALNGSTPVTLNDAAGAPMQYGAFGVGNQLNFQAVASNSNGDTYGLNVTSSAGANNTTSYSVWLVKLNNATGNGTVVANLTSLLPQDPNNAGVGTVVGVSAATFDPLNPNLLYFVAVDATPSLSSGGGGGGGGGGGTAVATPRLYSVDITNATGTLTAIPGTFGVTATTNAVAPTALGFNPSHQLIAFLASGAYAPPAQTTPGAAAGGGGGGGGGSSGSSSGGGVLARIPLGNTDGFTQLAAVQQIVNGTATGINNITGLVFIPGDSELDPTRYVLGIANNGAQSQLLRISLSTGLSTTWGGTEDTRDGLTPHRGDNLQDLTWNPNLIDPFTGQQGAVLAPDGNTDDLMFVDYRLRPPAANIFQVNVIRADSDAYISIAEAPKYDPENPLPTQLRPTAPYTGDAGTIRINDLQTGLSTLVTPTDGVVYIGTRTAHLSSNANANDDSLPLLSGQLNQSIGATLPTLTGQQMTSGLVVNDSTIMDFASSSQLMNGRLLGTNLNNIQGIAGGPSDHLAVIDSDLVDGNGDRTLSDELALVNPNSGIAYFGGGIYDKSTGLELSGVKALAYGDPSGSGTQTLYAVYSIGGVLKLGTLSEDQTPPTPGNLPAFGGFTTLGTIGGGITNIQCIAFTPDGQTLYAVDQNSHLVKLNPTNGALISTVGTIEDVNSHEVLRIKSMAFDAAAFAKDGTLSLYGQDFKYARLVDINVNTAVAGGVSATPRGSLPQTVGAIAYDPSLDAVGVAHDRFVAVDNAFGSTPLQAAQSPSDGSALMVLKGVTAAASTPMNMGKFLVGGTVTGDVNVSGSMGIFYSGELLTGKAGGITPGDSTTPNFVVNGDLNQLVVMDSIGTIGTQNTALNYDTGFNLQVGGVTGGVRAGNTFMGSADAQLNLDAPGSSHYQQEIESDQTISTTDTGAGAFQLGELNDPFFSNSTFANPQYLAGSKSDTAGQFNITVRGTIDNFQPADEADYYGVALMAGQKVAVQLSPDAPGGLNVGVFDPDGRLIQTDYNNVSPQSVTGQPFQFTADRPGVYRIAVATPGDTNFNGNLPGGGNNSPSSGLGTQIAVGYYLRVSDVGAIALGGVVAGTNIINPQIVLQPGTSSPLHLPGYDFHVGAGDLGAIAAGGTYYSQTEDSVDVASGNLRAIVAGYIGNGTADEYTWPDDNSSQIVTAGPASDPNIHVPIGSVGLLRSTIGQIAVNTEFATNETSNMPIGADGLAMAVGGFVQVVDSANEVASNLIADGGFGIIRGQTISGGSIVANADGVGLDGIIDLIDASNLLGTAISTGAGGDVRYVHATSVIRDPFFGGGLPEEQINFNPGQVATVRDDSGAMISITPQITGTNPLYNPNDAFNTGPYTGTAITNLVTYPIRGSGGAALVSFDANGSFDIKSSSSYAGASVEIGTINVSTGATGTQVILDGNGNPVFAATPTPIPPVGAPTQNPNYVRPGVNLGFGGSAEVDVLEINAPVTTVDNGAIDNISSNGELVSVAAGTIGGLAARRIGVAVSHYGEVINPRQLPVGNVIHTDTGTPSGGSGGGSTGGGSAGGGSTGGTTLSTSLLGDLYPFNQQHTGIQSGNIIAITSQEALGNVMVVGSIGSVAANAGGSNDPTVFKGITGPIVADGLAQVTGLATGGLAFISGSINSVQIGQGIAGSGGGAVSGGGIYAENRIGNVRNQGAGSDIRGTVMGGHSIGNITLNNGSLIGATILQVVPIAEDYSSARQGGYGGIAPSLPATVGNSPLTIGNINLPGNGGIIGTYIAGAYVGAINAPGFGILGMALGTITPGTFGNITAGGYGIRAVALRGGSSVGRMTATGNGSEAPTNSFEASVLQSATRAQFDPLSGLSISPMNDLYAFLGTSPANPVIVGVTDTGVIQNVVAIGARDFGGVQAWQIRNATFNFANSISDITTASTIGNLNVTTGKLGAFSPGSDVYYTTMVIAGPINTIRVNGSMLGGSTIYASGSNGTINNVSVATDLIGNIWATQRIGTISVGRNLSGTISISGGARKGGSLGSLFFGGTIANGALAIYGDVGTIMSGGSFGQAGDQLNIFGSLQSLQVHGDLHSNVHVTDTARTIDVWGSIFSGVTVAVDNTIGALLVGGDTQAGSIIRARVLDRLAVTGANMATYVIGA